MKCSYIHEYSYSSKRHTVAKISRLHAFTDYYTRFRDFHNTERPRDVITFTAAYINLKKIQQLHQTIDQRGKLRNLPRFTAKMKQTQLGSSKALFFLLLWTVLLCRSLQLPVNPAYSADQCACRPKSEWDRGRCREITQYPDHRNAFGFGGSSTNWSCLPDIDQVEEK